MYNTIRKISELTHAEKSGLVLNIGDDLYMEGVIIKAKDGGMISNCFTFKYNHGSEKINYLPKDKIDRTNAIYGTPYYIYKHLKTDYRKEKFTMIKHIVEHEVKWVE